METSSRVPAELDALSYLMVYEHLQLDELLVATCSCRWQRHRLKHLRWLNITAPSHCNVKLLSLLPAVTTVSAAIVRGAPPWEFAEADIAARLPFALTALPKITRLILTSPESWHGQDTPDDVMAVIYSLTRSLAKACQSMAFQNLEWIDLGYMHCPKASDEGTSCSCDDMARYFPPATVIEFLVRGDLCLSRMELLRLALGRGIDLNGAFAGNKAITVFHHVLKGLDPDDFPSREDIGIDVECCSVINHMVEFGGAVPDSKLLADASNGQLFDVDYPGYADCLSAWLLAGDVGQKFAWREKDFQSLSRAQPSTLDSTIKFLCGVPSIIWSRIFKVPKKAP